ncbi:MAG TPA: hypothetical protein VHY32_09425 [Caulobacteraceae bacterium]|jgi:hypothetical protein|nr:hypothetical protein [Caulobacteraceae bacterium]
MGNTPSYMQFRGDWRVGGRRRRTPPIAAIVLALTTSVAAIATAMHWLAAS